MMHRRSAHQQPRGGSSEEHETRGGRKSDSGTARSSLPGVWLASVVVLRLASAPLNQTAFVPDEYWQSLEVAHRMVFGYGYQTWEWREGIRGYTHPLLYATLYKILSLLHIDYAYLLIELPKVMNALLGVICDFYVFKLASFLYGSKAGTLALLCNLSSWFLFYCLPRSMANSLETVLTAPLLYHWFLAVTSSSLTPPHIRRRHTLVYLSISALAVLVRPTAVILSLPLVICHLCWRLRDLKMLLQCCVIVSVLALGWSLAVNWYFYQKVVFVQWRFFVFNVWKGHSALYGTHPWHWYLSQGAPAVLGTSLPLLLILPYLNQTPSILGLMALGGWTVLAYSLLAHKEFRFIMSVVPIASVLAGHALDLLLSMKKLRVLGRCGCVAMLINLPAILWFCLVHQRGTLDVMTFLRSNITDDSSILFLMPCHLTPYYSHIHRNIEMEVLECPPPLYEGDIDTQKEFYADPESWLAMKYDPHSNLPTHIVMFDVLVKEIESFLKLHKYQEITRLFHTLNPLESEIGTHIVVYRKY